MDEVLQKLLSSELLSEDAKAEISTKFTASVNAYKAAIREEVSLEVRAEISEQWTTERDALVANVQTFVETKLTEELNDLKADIERFRDLEAEFAEKIVEEKYNMAAQLEEEMEDLVNKMDAFFELRLNEEFEELREDLDVVKQNQFGRQIFEAFATEFNKSYVDEDSTQAKLTEALEQLEKMNEKVGVLEESKAEIVRETKLERILAPLSGKKREQMEFVLQNVETSRLEEAYKHFIGRVLKEDPAQTGGDKTLNESTSIVTGDDSSDSQKVAAGDKFSQLRKLAGI
jgi:hypothetical protein